MITGREPSYFEGHAVESARNLFSGIRRSLVIQVIQAGGQYQIVIGTHAKDVYEHLAGMMTFSQEAPEIKENPINRVIAMMSGCIAPFVYVLAAAGLLQGILIIIRLFVDISGTNHGLD